jgi:hypothetical protein
VTNPPPPQSIGIRLASLSMFGNFVCRPSSLTIVARHCVNLSPHVRSGRHRFNSTKRCCPDSWAKNRPAQEQRCPYLQLRLTGAPGHAGVTGDNSKARPNQTLDAGHWCVPGGEIGTAAINELCRTSQFLWLWNKCRKSQQRELAVYCRRRQSKVEIPGEGHPGAPSL